MAVRNALIDAAELRVKDVLGGKYRTVGYEKRAGTEDGESFSLADVLPDAKPIPFAESFWQHLLPLLTKQQFAALFLICRIRMRPVDVAKWLGISQPRIDRLLPAALAKIGWIVATNAPGRRAIVSAQFYAAEVATGTAQVKPSHAGFVHWLASVRFEGERWARGSDPVPMPVPKSRKLPAFRKLPSPAVSAGEPHYETESRRGPIDAFYHVESRSWQDAATMIAAQAAAELGVSLKRIKGPRPDRAARTKTHLS